jgi:sigma-B regulation protein RsbU (phosphoserine phosphatase)
VEQKIYPITLEQSKQEDTPILALKELVARLHKDQNKVQDLLSSLGFALRSFNNLNQFLELTPLIAARVADAEGGALILLKNNGQIRLEQVHCQNGYTCHGIREGIQKVTKDITIFKGNDSSFSLDEELKKYLPSEIQLFSIPILVKNIDRGRLYIFSSDPDYVWTSTRRNLVQLVVDQTSVAIAHHDLISELRKKEKQDRELEIGSEIQSHLLPGKCPEIEGVELAAICKTANRIGGDYYDFIPTNYDQVGKHGLNHNVPWSIVIGDVMGKGVPAGLIMTMTRGMLRAEILNRHSPAKILAHLNRVMYADLENSHRFVTLFYSEYDPVSKILSYSNAAHNPPLLWRYGSNYIEKLDTWGMLIGLEADSEYEDAKIQLHGGDAVLYYTDGLTDAVNQHGDRFDEDNLYQSFKWACLHFDHAQAILDYLLDSVNQFIGPENNYSDDITLVVMKVANSPNIA